MRIRLKTKMLFQGRIHNAGELVELPDGVKGPHQARQVTHDKIDYGTNPPIDANRILGKIEDVPLYEEVKEEK